MVKIHTILYAVPPYFPDDLNKLSDGCPNLSAITLDAAINGCIVRIWIPQIVILATKITAIRFPGCSVPISASRDSSNMDLLRYIIRHFEKRLPTYQNRYYNRTPHVHVYAEPQNRCSSDETRSDAREIFQHDSDGSSLSQTWRNGQTYGSYAWKMRIEIFW
jgi:hypothetical protein